MTTLRYKPHAHIDDLEIGECTMHPAGDSSGARWWLLWFRVNREDSGLPADFAVPMNPNGDWNESGPGGKTWGLTRNIAGQWDVHPSINVLAHAEIHPGPKTCAHCDSALPSQWHQTPSIVDVPDDEPWTRRAP